jgi:hypothetical protein
MYTLTLDLYDANNNLLSTTEKSFDKFLFHKLNENKYVIFNVKKESQYLGLEFFESMIDYSHLSPQTIKKYMTEGKIKWIKTFINNEDNFHPIAKFRNTDNLHYHCRLH